MAFTLDFGSRSEGCVITTTSLVTVFDFRHICRPMSGLLGHHLGEAVICAFVQACSRDICVIDAGEDHCGVMSSAGIARGSADECSFAETVPE